MALAYFETHPLDETHFAALFRNPGTMLFPCMTVVSTMVSKRCERISSLRGAIGPCIHGSGAEAPRESAVPDGVRPACKCRGGLHRPGKRVMQSYKLSGQWAPERSGGGLVNLAIGHGSRQSSFFLGGFALGGAPEKSRKRWGWFPKLLHVDKGQGPGLLRAPRSREKPRFTGSRS